MAAHPTTTEGLPRVPLPEQQPTMSVPDAGACLGLGKVASYQAVKDGFIPVIRTSRSRMRVPTAELRRLLRLDVAPHDPQVTSPGVTEPGPGPTLPVRRVPARGAVVEGGDEA